MARCNQCDIEMSSKFIEEDTNYYTYECGTDDDRPLTVRIYLCTCPRCGCTEYDIVEQNIRPLSHNISNL